MRPENLEAIKGFLTESEQIAYDKFTAMGLIVAHKGGPDFWCFDPKNKTPTGVFVVEVKNGRDEPTLAQKIFMSLLKEWGFNVQVIRTKPKRRNPTHADPLPSMPGRTHPDQTNR